MELLSTRLRSHAWPPALLVFVATTFAADGSDHGRLQFSISSMLRLEHFGQAVLSPDASHVAYEYLAPYETLKDFSVFGYRPDLGFTGSRIYWREVATGVEHVVADDGGATRFWTAGFSPDSSRLAFFAGDGRSASTWVYDWRTKAVRKFAIVPNLRWEQYFPLVWVSPDEFIIATLPLGRMPEPLDTRGAQAMIIGEQWRRAFAGQEPSAQVWFSGAEQKEAIERPGGLIRVNVATGTVTMLAKGDFIGLELSPSGRWLACLERCERLAYIPGKPPDGPAPIWRNQLRIFDLPGTARAVPSDRLDVAMGSVCWDDRDDVLVFFSRQYDQRWREGLAWRWSMDAAQPHCMSAMGTLEFAAFGTPWLNGRQAPIVPAANGALVYANVKSSSAPAQNGWYLIGAEGEPRLLSPGLEGVSGATPSRQREGWVIIAGGRPWLISAETKPQALEWHEGEIWSELRSRRFENLIRNDPGVPRGAFQVKRAEQSEIVHLDGSGAIDGRISYPDLTAILGSASARLEGALFTVSDDAGTHLQLAKSGSATGDLRTINAAAALLRRPLIKHFPVRTANGTEVTCSIMLPPDWQPGTRLPAIVHAYPTTQVGVPEVFTATTMSSANQLAFFGYGYAVIFPNYPFRTARTPEKPFARLTEFNNAAVDEAGRLGYIDPTRVGLWGASFGGEAVVHIAGETDRYRAAMALCGVVDYISRAGQYTGRYLAYPDEWVPGAWANYYEGTGSVTHIEGPGVWQDLERYLRASPIYNISRIRTPLALVYGEMDSTGVSQFDEAFAALNHLGKDGMFLRYWGEDHGFTSPANIRDVWARTMEWFDRYLDISRNSDGTIEYEEGSPKSRRGKPSWSVENFLTFEKLR